MEQPRNQRRFKLRAATAAAHQALEDELGQISSQGQYLRYLAAMTKFRGAIEPMLSATNDGEAFQPTTIHACLLLDCADLGVTDVAPPPTSIVGVGGARLGIAYVLEGSAMGASLLIKSARRLGFDESYGARHLSRQVAHRSNWAAFVHVLEEHPSLDMEEVTAAANATFELARAAAGVGVHAG